VGMQSRVRRAGVVGALAMLLVAGCTGPEPEPEPAAEPTRSPAPTVRPTPIPSPTRTQPAVVAPEPPPELQRSDADGAAAAATYFLSLYGYTMQTGDVGPWTTMTGEPCQFCARTRGLATSIHDAGDTFAGADITPLSTFVHPYDELVGGYPVDVEYTQAASEHRNAQGELVNVSDPDGGTLGVDLIHAPDGWKVIAVTAQDEQ
jgi:hypothetical protein